MPTKRFDHYKCYKVGIRDARDTGDAFPEAKERVSLLQNVELSTLKRASSLVYFFPRASLGPVCLSWCVFVSVRESSSSSLPPRAHPQERKSALWDAGRRQSPDDRLHGNRGPCPVSTWQLLNRNSVEKFRETLVRLWAAACAFVLLYAIWTPPWSQLFRGKSVWNSNRIWTWECSRINLFQMKDLNSLNCVSVGYDGEKCFVGCFWFQDHTYEATWSCSSGPFIHASHASRWT